MKSPEIRLDFEAAKRFILDGLSCGALKPRIAQSFVFDQIVEAHRFLELSDQIGKLVITIPEKGTS
jgi:NADPH:quinone reductase-like Zn-dependent oxidoreductase